MMQLQTSRLSSSSRCEVCPIHTRLTQELSATIDIENELGVALPPLLREHPDSTLYAASRLLMQTHARRLPLLDNDTETGHEVIVSVLTRQYRLLKYISINVCCTRL